ALAVPAYGRYSFRARRVEARELLMRTAAAQERFYTNFNRYAANPVTAASSLGIKDTSEHGYYKVTTENGPTGDTQSYLLKVAPQNAQASDKCGTMTLNNNGAKTPLPTDTTANSNGACW
ncbi:MAG TPA: type IV pilin protein, partial [Tahibacter sp.]|nr:type IV pilin protein [Tahibacter sp.]